jgi:hypothetical protein
MGGSNDVDNLIALSKAEHIEVHALFYGAVEQYFITILNNKIEPETLSEEEYQDYIDLKIGVEEALTQSRKSVTVLCSKFKHLFSIDPKLNTAANVLTNIHDGELDKSAIDHIENVWRSRCRQNLLNNRILYGTANNSDKLDSKPETYVLK